MASMRLNFYGVGVERLETCTQGHNKGGRAEGIIMPETLGRTGEGKVFSVFENYHLPDVTISKQIELSSF